MEYLSKLREIDLIDTEIDEMGLDAVNAYNAKILEITNFIDSINEWTYTLHESQDCAFHVIINVMINQLDVCKIFISKHGVITSLYLTELKRGEWDSNQIKKILIQQVLKSGFFYIPKEVLDAQYDGKLKHLGTNCTWWIRFLDYY
jgi:hypothetical protein